ncbi:hypothetical protein niasHT_034633 [Heterodera trifolii]|uniref:Band 3 cytoplasmic domain-containing protein n=1 Tax=Heterodera trifolii TaxID=157864 RepID=A0ABD2IQG8_9BILA
MIELFELKLRHEERVGLPLGCWEETARWIKYEEDVEGVDHQRWGLPHISFLSFHALLQLRKCIAKGIVLLDVDVVDFTELSDTVANAIANELPELGQRIWASQQISKILQLRKNHVKDRRISRISTTATSLAAHFLERGATEKTHLLTTPRRTTSAMSLSTTAGGGATGKRTATEEEKVTIRFNGCSFSKSPPTIAEDDESTLVVDMAKPSSDQPRTEPPHNQQLQISPPHVKRKFSTPNVRLNFDSFLPGKLHHSEVGIKRRTSSKKRRPSLNDTTRSMPAMHKFSFVGSQKKATPDEDGEFVQVLVGEVHWMRKPRFVMVRLDEGRPMPEIVDTCCPVRIVFVILGPTLSDGSYHELGRSLSTLVSNPHFKAIAFDAKDRDELIDGLDSFLDGSLVIPPGEIASKRLISGDILLKLHRRWQRERKMPKQQKVVPAIDAEWHRYDGEVEADGGNLKTTAEDGESRHYQSNNNQQKQQGHLAANGDENDDNGQEEQQKQWQKEGGGEEQQKQTQQNWTKGGTKSAQRTKRKRRFPLFKGLQADFVNRLPFYWSDIRDAANFQCLTRGVSAIYSVPSI